MNVYHIFFFFQICNLFGAKEHNQSTPEYILPNEVNHQSVNKAIYKDNPKKPFTLLVYMAADNDLRSFATYNIQQMADIGSNANINILVHLDIKMNANQKITKRYYIKNKQSIIATNINDHLTQSMDSGDPITLVSAVQWAVENYPAENYGLILWNHGSGIIDPERYRTVNPASLFIFNPKTNKLDLNRNNAGFINLIENPENAKNDKGICWDDTTHNYLTNQKLINALDYINTNILRQKFSFIGFDACLMSMLEIADYLQNYARFMIASQEVELGSGWNYRTSLAPFLNTTPNMINFMEYIVQTYEQSYSNITNDYTLAAINLEQIDEITTNVNQLASYLISAIQHDTSNTTINTIKKCASKNYCTYFEEPSYIDLYHFYTNLEKQITIHIVSDFTLLQSIQKTITKGKKILKTAVIQSCAGKNLLNAHGISIYFPTNRIHASYKKTQFAKKNQWFNLLTACI